MAAQGFVLLHDLSRLSKSRRAYVSRMRLEAIGNARSAIQMAKVVTTMIKLVGLEIAEPKAIECNEAKFAEFEGVQLHEFVVGCPDQDPTVDQAIAELRNDLVGLWESLNIKVNFKDNMDSLRKIHTCFRFPAIDKAKEVTLSEPQYEHYDEVTLKASIVDRILVWFQIEYCSVVVWNIGTTLQPPPPEANEEANEEENDGTEMHENVEQEPDSSSTDGKEEGHEDQEKLAPKEEQQQEEIARANKELKENLKEWASKPLTPQHFKTHRYDIRRGHEPPTYYDVKMQNKPIGPFIHELRLDLLRRARDEVSMVEQVMALLKYVDFADGVGPVRLYSDIDEEKFIKLKGIPLYNVFEGLLVACGEKAPPERLATQIAIGKLQAVLANFWHKANISVDLSAGLSDLSQIKFFIRFACRNKAAESYLSLIEFKDYDWLSLWAAMAIRVVRWIHETYADYITNSITTTFASVLGKRQTEEQAQKEKEEEKEEEEERKERVEKEVKEAVTLDRENEN